MIILFVVIFKKRGETRNKQTTHTHYKMMSHVHLSPHHLKMSIEKANNRERGENEDTSCEPAALTLTLRVKRERERERVEGLGLACTFTYIQQKPALSVISHMPKLAMFLFLLHFPQLPSPLSLYIYIIFFKIKKHNRFSVR